MLIKEYFRITTWPLPLLGKTNKRYYLSKVILTSFILDITEIFRNKSVLVLIKYITGKENFYYSEETVIFELLKCLSVTLVVIILLSLFHKIVIISTNSLRCILLGINVLSNQPLFPLPYYWNVLISNGEFSKVYPKSLSI